MTTYSRSDRCTATSKRTHRRCGQIVPGGGDRAVCRWHGGAAGQVVRARDVRLAVAEARALYADEFADRDPGEVLLAAVRDVDNLVQKLKAQVELSGELMPSHVEALGQWLDRAARMARSVLDAGVQERLARLRESQGALVADAIRNILGDLGMDVRSPEVMQVVSRRLTELSGE